jgi:hypothetical protein
MSLHWTETLTLIARRGAEQEIVRQIRETAASLELIVDQVTTRPRRTGSTRLQVRLSGSADRISDFEKVMAGDGWSAVAQGSLLDPLISGALPRSYQVTPMVLGR